MYNKELDKFICWIDGRITVFRQEHLDNSTIKVDDERLLYLIEVQKLLHKIYILNHNYKGTVRKI